MNPAEMNPERVRQLDQMLSAYRQATAYGEGGPNFMPELWARIDSRRAQSLLIMRVSRIFASAAVALAVVAGLFSVFTPQAPSEDTWVEAIATHQLAQNAMYFEPVRLSPALATVPARAVR